MLKSPGFKVIFTYSKNGLSLFLLHTNVSKKGTVEPSVRWRSLVYSCGFRFGFAYLDLWPLLLCCDFGRAGVSALLCFDCVHPQETHISSGIYVLKLQDILHNQYMSFPGMLSLTVCFMTECKLQSAQVHADVYTLLSMSDNQLVLLVLTHCLEVCCVWAVPPVQCESLVSFVKDK